MLEVGFFCFFGLNFVVLLRGNKLFVKSYIKYILFSA